MIETASKRLRVGAACWILVCCSWGAVVGITVSFVLGLFLLPSFAILAAIGERHRFGRGTVLALFGGYETGALALTIWMGAGSPLAEWMRGGWLITRVVVAAFGLVPLLLGLRATNRGTPRTRATVEQHA
jgi:hypothetical protein